MILLTSILVLEEENEMKELERRIDETERYLMEVEGLLLDVEFSRIPNHTKNDLLSTLEEERDLLRIDFNSKMWLHLLIIIFVS